MGKRRNVLFLQSSSELYGSGKILLQVLRIYRDQGLNPVVVMTGEGPLGELGSWLQTGHAICLIF